MDPNPKAPLFDGSRGSLSLSPLQVFHVRSCLEKLRAGAYALETIESCPCGSDASLKLIDGDRFGFPVGIVACVTCGLVRTSPRLAARCLPDFYGDDYHALHFGIAEPDPDHALHRAGQGRIIYNYVKDVLIGPHVQVAEVGAATGTVLREFSSAAVRDGRMVTAVGCEYSPAFVEAGRLRGTDLRVGGIEALVRTPAPDLMILSHVLEHFADLDAELARIRSIIQPSTLVYVEVPGILSIHEKPEYDFTFEHYVTIAHNYHFTLATLIDVMARAGFHLITGDEVVRSVFRIADAGTSWSPPVDAQRRYLETVTYVEWLNKSRTLAVRRRIVRVRRKVRARLAVLARNPVGTRLLGALRRNRRTSDHPGRC